MTRTQAFSWRSAALLPLLLLARAQAAAAPQNVLWLPLGDSISFGCTGPTIQDCHADAAGYRVPLALALTQAPLGSPDLLGFNVSTMGTSTTGPAYVPAQWLHHDGHPGWTIPMIDNLLPKSLATSQQRPDIITIHLGTNDCNGGHSTAQMVSDMHSLLNHTFTLSPASHVFLADTIGTGPPSTFNSCIVEWNAQVPGLVDAWAAKGMKVSFVPMFAEARICGAQGADADLCGAHQVHPTSAGYPRMASAFALAIMKNFARAS